MNFDLGVDLRAGGGPVIKSLSFVLFIIYALLLKCIFIFSVLIMKVLSTGYTYQK